MRSAQSPSLRFVSPYSFRGLGQAGSPQLAARALPQAAALQLLRNTDSFVGAARAAPTETLNPGATGPAVKALQDSLYKLGYMPSQQGTGGYGRFGPQTLQGLLRYQEAHGINNTGGQYGPRTQAALEQSLTRFTAAKGIAQTTAAADKHYVSQWGPTPSNSNKAPYGFADCGPTSGLMALSSLGLIEKPSAQNASKVIDSIRDAAVGHNTNYSRLMGFPMLAQGLNRFGARTRMIQGGIEGFEAALARGNPIILGGNPWNAWGKEQRAKGNYLANGDGGHFVTVFGKTPDGKYIVGDPLFIKGTQAVTYEQLRKFSAPGYGAMEVMRP